MSYGTLLKNTFPPNLLPQKKKKYMNVLNFNVSLVHNIFLKNIFQLKIMFFKFFFFFTSSHQKHIYIYKTSKNINLILS
jgi:hypothetical protein